MARLVGEVHLLGLHFGKFPEVVAVVFFCNKNTPLGWWHPYLSGRAGFFGELVVNLWNKCWGKLCQASSNNACIHAYINMYLRNPPKPAVFSYIPVKDPQVPTTWIGKALKSLDGLLDEADDSRRPGWPVMIFSKWEKPVTLGLTPVPSWSGKQLAPEGSPKPKFGKDRLPVPPWILGSMLNFGGGG